MRYEALICDFDGTLADTRAAVCKCIFSTIRHFYGSQQSLDEGMIEATLSTGATLQTTFEKLLSQINQTQSSAVEQCVTLYRQHYNVHSQNWTKLYPGVREALSTAQAHGIRLAVISNKGEVALQKALDDLSILTCFDLILGEQPDILPKPAPDLFNKCVIPFFKGIDRSKTLFVGDTKADMLFASRAGIVGCWASYGHGRAEDCRNLKPRYEIKRFDEIENIFFPLLER